MAESNQWSYCSGQNQFLAFCRMAKVQVVTASEGVLCQFVLYLESEKLKHSTIKAYLSGIRCYQIQQSLGNPFANGGLPRLEYVLSGIKWVEAQAGPPARVHLPITMEIMKQLKAAWLSQPQEPDCIMLWAAACTGFFAFLRVGEFTVSSSRAYDPYVHLNLSDLAIDSHSAPAMIRIRI